MRKQQGLSLIELMISITIGIILMTGVVQMFITSRISFSTQQGISRIQETGRFAIEFLSRDIRMAGYLGCIDRANPQISNTLNTANGFYYRMDVGIEGYTAAPATSNLNPAPLANTDVLVIRSANGNNAAVAVNNSSAQLFITDTGTVANACPGSTASYSGICDKDILIVSDCVKARVFQATNVQQNAGLINIAHAAAGTPGNAMVSWGAAANPDPIFGPGAEVLTVNNTVYYIAASNVSEEPSLYQKINNNAPLELLEGVEDMHLTYSRSNSPSVFQDAATLPANAWTDTENPVVSVRIELLVRSVQDNVLDQPQSFIFPTGTPERMPDPLDRRMRQVFVNTVGIRSRLP
jgi:type IV pilus assembly protein PilW